MFNKNQKSSWIQVPFSARADLIALPRYVMNASASELPCGQSGVNVSCLIPSFVR